MVKTEKLIEGIDIQIAVSVGICLLLSYAVPHYQAMTACIATLLCVQDSLQPSFKTGTTRLLITAIGGAVGIAVVLLDGMSSRPALFVLLAVLGVLLTLLCCKLAKVPYISARIGGVTFVLVVLTRAGTERIEYAAFRLLSTLYGVVVVLVVSAVFAAAARKKTDR